MLEAFVKVKLFFGAGAAVGLVFGLAFAQSVLGRHSMIHEGRLRVASITRSPGPYSQAPILVVALHGAGSGALQFERESGFSALPRKGDVLVAYPQGLGPLLRRRSSWNADRCCGYAQEKGIDDTGYILRLIDEVCRTTGFGCSRVFVVGHSNGGMLAQKIAAEHGDKIDGFASVAGAMNSPQVDGPPVTAVMIHGAEDKIVRPEGGRPLEGYLRNREDRSLAEAETYWIRRSGRARVQVELLPGHGHSWPSSVQGKPTYQYIWEQLARGR